jgi:TPR repeat protein
MALLEKAAGQGHTYAMSTLGGIHHNRKEYEQAVGWMRKGAEAGLPEAMFNLGRGFESGRGVVAPDYPAAADWYRRAADAGDAEAADNLAALYSDGRGRAWRTMPATFQYLVPCVEWHPPTWRHYLPDPRARRHA